MDDAHTMVFRGNNVTWMKPDPIVKLYWIVKGIHERIQHMTVTRGPLMSMLGLSDINLYTAGTSSFGSSVASRGMFGAGTDR